MILCCGEALIDMIPNEVGAFEPIAGGSVFNTAIGLGRQGVPVGLLSGVSTDLFGQVLVDALTQSDVDTQTLIRSDRPTTLAFVKLVDGSASYAFYDENTAGRMIVQRDVPDTLPKDITALFFGGISLAVEPCAETYSSVLEKFGHDSVVMVDPNVRQSFIADENRYRARMAGILGNSDIVKISEEDLEWWDPENSSLEAKVAQLLKTGPSFVCLTLGSKGSELHDAKGLRCQMRAPTKQVVDTVGAGDAFSAGFLTSLYRQNQLSKDKVQHWSDAVLNDALEFASLFSADTVTRKGSDPAWNFVVSNR